MLLIQLVLIPTHHQDLTREVWTVGGCFGFCFYTSAAIITGLTFVQHLKLLIIFALASSPQKSSETGMPSHGMVLESPGQAKLILLKPQACAVFVKNHRNTVVRSRSAFGPLPVAMRVKLVANAVFITDLVC